MAGIRFQNGVARIRCHPLYTFGITWVDTMGVQRVNGVGGGGKIKNHTYISIDSSSLTRPNLFWKIHFYKEYTNVAQREKKKMY